MNIYDIATEAGVSIATVSRVINDPSVVSPKTLAKVNEVIEKYHFSPNAIARGLVSNSSKNIAIMLSDIRNPHFTTAAYTLERLFFQWGYTTLFCNTGDALTGKMDYIHLLAGKRIDGMVLLGSVFDDVQIDRVINDFLHDIPIIGSNFSFPGKNCYSVQVNHTIGMRLSVQHLMDRGFEELSFVSYNDSTNTRNKIQGFLHAMESFGQPVDMSRQLLNCAPGPAGGRQFVRELLKTLDIAEKRRGFIFMDDQTAIGAVSEFRKEGITIPEQVGIIGHDNSVFCIASEPMLTTIDTRIEEMAQIIAKTMQHVLQGETVGNSIDLSPKLVIREST